jgi:hypothetical protein
LGFLQILLLENRWYLAGRGVRSDVLAHLVLLRTSLDVHLWTAHGAMQKLRRVQGQQQWRR